MQLITNDDPYLKYICYMLSSDVFFKAWRRDKSSNISSLFTA